MLSSIYRQPFARFVGVLAVVYTVYYIFWRATETLSHEWFAFSVILLIAEAHGAISLALFVFMTWDVETQPRFVPRDGLSVDVFVPTYNEDLDILEATLVGCRGIRYPHTTYVLDDGRRPAVAELAARLGAHYLTREDNRHAKAGNINAALEKTDGEFVVVLDADTVPQPDYLDETLGYFVDERVALVQLPQEFYNVDSVQYARGETEGPWHEQALFYRVIQPGKNRWNAAFWCGSPSVVRRRALESVGGVATDTITEDIHTTVRLHSRGWRTVFHDGQLAYGIAPQTIESFAVQRLRWAQGTMQLLRGPENPVIIKGLTLAQRLNYFASTATYFDSFQKLVYLAAPATVLLTGAVPLDVSGASFLVHWLPYMLLGTLANVALGRGTFRYIQVELFNLLKMFTFIVASTTLISARPLRFVVTPKRADRSAAAQERQTLAPHMVLLGFSIGAMLIGLGNFIWGLTARFYDEDIVLVTVIWSVINAIALVYGIYLVLSRVNRLRRANYRFQVRLTGYVRPVDSGGSAAHVNDLSREGAGVIVGRPIARGSSVELSVDLPDGRLLLRAEVASSAALGDGRYRLGVHFLRDDPTAHERLVNYLFVALPRQHQDRRRAIKERWAQRLRLIPAPGRS